MVVDVHLSGMSLYLREPYLVGRDERGSQAPEGWGGGHGRARVLGDIPHLRHMTLQMDTADITESTMTPEEYKR